MRVCVYSGQVVEWDVKKDGVAPGAHVGEPANVA